jgi:hypothetical protein
MTVTDEELLQASADLRVALGRLIRRLRERGFLVDTDIEESRMPRFTR